ncbi:hypothetical protein A5865_001037 [Enterococcus sp. 12E11_DIV0728]|nr:hypothetical protein A5865_001037 [Enterococcus sp. 12E11_DIV0728]
MCIRDSQKRASLCSYWSIVLDTD